MKIVTHNAKFHADDVFAVASLLIIYPDAEVVRTRDKSIIEAADIVLDVGEIYNAEANRFDHHQIETAGQRPNGILYSSFGLVWKKFGSKIAGSTEVMERIDSMLVQTVDAGDNGMNLFRPIIEGVSPYLIHGIIDQYRLTWKESGSGNWDERFDECVKWAKSFLERLIRTQQDVVEGENIVKEAYSATSDKRLVVIDEKYDLGRELVTHVLTALPDTLYTVLYRHDHKNWQLVAVRKSPGSFELRKALPEAWRAKHEADFEQVSGVEGAVYCHRRGFMCIAKTRDAVLKLAEIALNS